MCLNISRRTVAADQQLARVTVRLLQVNLWLVLRPDLDVMARRVADGLQRFTHKLQCIGIESDTLKPLAHCDSSHDAISTVSHHLALSQTSAMEEREEEKMDDAPCTPVCQV